MTELTKTQQYYRENKERILKYQKEYHKKFYKGKNILYSNLYNKIYHETLNKYGINRQLDGYYDKYYPIRDKILSEVKKRFKEQKKYIKNKKTIEIKPKIQEQPKIIETKIEIPEQPKLIEIKPKIIENKDEETIILTFV